MSKVITKNEIYVPESEVSLVRTHEVPTEKDGRPEGHILVVGGGQNIVNFLKCL